MSLRKCFRSVFGERIPMTEAMCSCLTPIAARERISLRWSFVGLKLGRDIERYLPVSNRFRIASGIARVTYFVEWFAVRLKHRPFARHSLPALDDRVDVTGVDLDAVTDAVHRVGGNECRSRAEERIVDDPALFGVVQDGPAHELDRLLCTVTSRSIFGGVLSGSRSEGVEIRDLP